jgi:hypothetical protein
VNDARKGGNPPRTSARPRRSLDRQTDRDDREFSDKDYASLSLAAPQFGLRKLYANLSRAASRDADNIVDDLEPAD